MWKGPGLSSYRRGAGSCRLLWPDGTWVHTLMLPGKFLAPCERAALRSEVSLLKVPHGAWGDAAFGEGSPPPGAFPGL